MTRILGTAVLVWATGLCATGLLLPDLLSGDVVVIANQTDTPVEFRIASPDGEVHENRVVAQGQTVVTTTGSVDLLYDVGGELVRYRLDANSAYYFTHDANQWLDLRKIQLGGDASTYSGRSLPPEQSTDDVGRILIKILVDDGEPTTQRFWEPRIRKRIAAVSDILERTCRLRLEVVAVDQWDSSGELQDVGLLLREFQQRVDPQPASLAIGFSSGSDSRGADKPTEKSHLGGSPGLLKRHILIQEWSSTISEAERIEVLLHEIGHYLGAVHSPDPNSVMRPLLGDGKARIRAFEIKFDPINTLLLNLVGEEIRRQDIRALNDLSVETRLRLLQIYGAVGKAIPSDASAQHFQIQLGMAANSPLANGTRHVVQQLTELLTNADRDPPKARAFRTQVSPVKHDGLTERCVRRAADAATSLPDEVARQAFLLGLGITMDDSDTLLKNWITGDFCRSVDPPNQRDLRKPSADELTIFGRRDLTQHFFVSAFLTVAAGQEMAATAGLAKEVMDARSGGHFSYVDLAADMAGTAFANQLLNHKLKLDDLAKRFVVTDHMPDVIGLPDKLDWRDLAKHLSGKGMNSLVGYRREILRRINQCKAE